MATTVFVLIALLAGVGVWTVTRTNQAPAQVQLEQTEPSRWVRFVAWVERNDKAVTATSTAVIAVFTLALFIATAALWTASERHSARELRPYVFIRGGEIRLVNNAAEIIATIQVQNYGKTPAYDFETWTGIQIGQPGDNPYGTTGPPRQRSIIGPDADLNIPSARIPISPAERQAVNNGQAMIFVWGYVRYRDAFGKKWEFIFRDTNGNGELATAQWIGWGITPDIRYGYTESRRR